MFFVNIFRFTKLLYFCKVTLLWDFVLSVFFLFLAKEIYTKMRMTFLLLLLMNPCHPELTEFQPFLTKIFPKLMRWINQDRNFHSRNTFTFCHSFCHNFYEILLYKIFKKKTRQHFLKSQKISHQKYIAKPTIR